MDVQRLKGKIALVTGAGSGVGRQIAVDLHRLGAVPVLCDVRIEALRESAGLIAGNGGNLMLEKADITREADINRLFEKIAARYERLDMLIHCAAVWDAAGILEIDDARLDRMLDINLKGVIRMCRSAFAIMSRQAEGGAIVNIASTAGEYGSIRPASHYAASKGGVIAFSKSLAREGAPLKIRVNVVSPGPLDTPMTNIVNDEQRAQVGGRTLLGRMGTPADISHAALFLASEQASWITGEVLRVNGGSLI